MVIRNREVTLQSSLVYPKSYMALYFCGFSATAYDIRQDAFSYIDGFMEIITPTICNK